MVWHIDRVCSFLERAYRHFKVVVAVVVIVVVVVVIVLVVVMIEYGLS